MLRQWLWIIPAAIGAGLTGLTLFVLSPDRVIDGIPEFLFKLIPLVAAVLAIALFPKNGRGTSWLLVLGFIFYMGYIDSTYVIQIDKLIDAAIAGTYAEQFPVFYTFNLFVNAFTVLLVVFAYRLGGASAARTLKLGLAGILIIISGLNDLTFWAMYSWPNGRPFVFHWASHVAIFVGGEPNLYHMLAFLGIHLALVGIVLWLPLEKWIDSLKKRWRFEEGSARSTPERPEQA